MSEDNKVLFFVKGLRPGIKRLVTGKRPATFQKAMEFAQDAERYVQASQLEDTTKSKILQLLQDKPMDASSTATSHSTTPVVQQATQASNIPAPAHTPHIAALQHPYIPPYANLAPLYASTAPAIPPWSNHPGNQLSQYEYPQSGYPAHIMGNSLPDNDPTLATFQYRQPYHPRVPYAPPTQQAYQQQQQQGFSSQQYMAPTQRPWMNNQRNNTFRGRGMYRGNRPFSGNQQQRSFSTNNAQSDQQEMMNMFRLIMSFMAPRRGGARGRQNANNNNTNGTSNNSANNGESTNQGN